MRLLWGNIAWLGKVFRRPVQNLVEAAYVAWPVAAGGVCQWWLAGGRYTFPRTPSCRAYL
ncbi:hypothetical protein [Chthonomonas calidirosea]|uniref:hypothetical protein n=1 Tax=Chthonomonas calidirosea TaxID=454171 RepID=UPI0012E34017|nr:hypothetical protein [Chthonomonas calidirosea]